MTGPYLVCLPFGGGGAGFFYPWTEAAGDRMNIIAMRLPGRERQIDDEPFRDLQEAADYLFDQLTAVLATPARVILFGHSLGAALAYELAQRLRHHPGVELVHLFASGSPDPSTQRSLRATGIADDDEFLERVRLISSYSDAALLNPEIRELVLPTLRADVQMHEEYQPSTMIALPCPITALRGKDDVLVTADEAAKWAQLTTEFALVEMSGEHMYIIDSMAPLLELITERAGKTTP
jgi:surfactin synthase thioesterase subunit